MTSEKEDFNRYFLLEVSPLGVKEIDAWDCDHVWEEEPLLFTVSPYLILSPLFKNDDWKGKQKLFSLATREWCDIALPRGMSKHKLQNMTDNFCLTFLYDRGLKELALCQID